VRVGNLPTVSTLASAHTLRESNPRPCSARSAGPAPSRTAIRHRRAAHTRPEGEAGTKARVPYRPERPLRRTGPARNTTARVVCRPELPLRRTVAMAARRRPAADPSRPREPNRAAARPTAAAAVAVTVVLTTVVLVPRPRRGFRANRTGFAGRRSRREGLCLTRALLGGQGRGEVALDEHGCRCCRSYRARS
jgi:hypothetical protein